MLRERMIRTMPVVMIATAADWTDRFHRFRGVRKRPPDSMLKASHRMTRAATSPSRRLSTSRPANMDRAVRFGGVVATVGCSIAWASVMTTPHRRQMVWERPASRETASAGRVTWISDGLRATGDGARRNVLAELCLGQPLRVEDDLEVVLRDRHGLEQESRAVDPARGLGRRSAGDLGDVGILAQLEGGLAGLRAELGRVLPDADDLGAEGDAVEGGLVAVLATDLDGTTLVPVERGDDAGRHAVVLREHGLDVVLVGRQDLLHLGLRVLRLPAVGVDLGAGRDLDRTRGDERGDDLLHALAKEERVGLAELTLDDRVVAGRLGRRDCAGDHPSDFDVVVC